MRCRAVAIGGATGVGLVALLRTRIGAALVYVTTGVIVALYAAPLVASLRLASVPAPKRPLPPLAVPAMVPPLLRVPRRRSLPALPALPPPRVAVQVVVQPRRVPVRRHVRVPVVADVRTELAAPAPRRAKPARDPSAGAPVVRDTIGAPAELPADAAAPADATVVDSTAADAARAPPAGENTQEPVRGAHGLQWFDDQAPPADPNPPADRQQPPPQDQPQQQQTDPGTGAVAPADGGSVTSAATTTNVSIADHQTATAPSNITAVSPVSSSSATDAATGAAAVTSTVDADTHPVTAALQVATAAVPESQNTFTGGAGTGDWNTPQNWSLGTAPGPADAVVISAGSTVTLATAQSSTILNLTNQGSLTVNGALAITDTTVLSTSNVLNLQGTLSGAGSMSIGSALNWAGGVISGTGQTVVEAAATLTISGTADKTLDTRVLDNKGTLAWIAGRIVAQNGAAVVNEGLFDIQSSANYIAAGSTAVFNNLGTVEKRTSAGTTTFAGNVQFNGTGGQVDVLAGTLALAGGGAQSNVTFASATGATTTFAGGTFTSDGSTFTGPGLTRVNGATVTFTGASTSTGGVFELAAGTVNGTADLTVNGGTLAWTGGVLSGTGQTIVGPGATLTISGAADKTLDTTMLVNHGSATWSAGRIVAQSGSVFDNSSDGTLVASGSSYLYNGGTVPSFRNEGLYRRTGDNSTTLFTTVNFTNSGVLELDQGVVQLNGGSLTQTSTGTLLVGIGGAAIASGKAELVVNAPLALAGTWGILSENGFTPQSGVLFRMIANTGTRTGIFANAGYQEPVTSRWAMAQFGAGAVNISYVPTVTVEDVAGSEGDSGTTPFVFTYTLSEPSTQTVTIQYATADGTATSTPDDADYAPAAGTLTFAAGTIVQTLDVAVNGDEVYDHDVSFSVTVTSATGAYVSRRSALGTIMNDDPAPQLSIGDVAVTVAGLGPSIATFPVSIVGATELPARVDDSTGATLVFAPGEAAKTISVSIDPATIPASGTTVFVDLSNAVDATIARARGTATIDVPTTTTLGVSPSPSAFGEAVTLTAHVAGADPATPVSGTVSFFDGSTSLGTVAVGVPLVVGSLGVGLHHLSASYSGNLDPSMGGAVQQVDRASTTMTLVGTPSPSAYGQAVIFTATVTGAPTGVVQFFIDGSAVGTGPLSAGGVATFKATSLAVGTHTITATYSGDDNFGGSTGSSTQIVIDTTPPSIVIRSPVDGRTSDVATMLTVRYSARDRRGDAVTVETAQLDGTGPSYASGSAIDTSKLAAGAHTFTVVAHDAAGNVATKTITFRIRATPGGLIRGVLGLVGHGIDPREAVPLLTRLAVAVVATALDATRIARDALRWFVAEVAAQSGRRIDPAVAAVLTQWTNDLIASL